MNGSVKIGPQDNVKVDVDGDYFSEDLFLVVGRRNHKMFVIEIQIVGGSILER